jgi:cyclopropane-fatty-acyl-phospholipid synthase
MGLIDGIARVGEALPWPDPLLRRAIGLLVARTDRQLRTASPEATRLFAETMRHFPVATHTAAANEQHYELPERFFGLVLGPHRKYSCCIFPTAAATLAEAEEHALAQTAENAALEDGQTILELGCGWGSLSLWMAERFPRAQITSVSSSHSQRAYVVDEAARRGLTNLAVLVADMNAFSVDKTFDRIVSIEMFEHMANWPLLLSRLRGRLTPNGRVLVHVFSHVETPYRFDHSDPNDWIAKHFFTGGIMPSHRLMHAFPESLSVERDWRWGGEHYRRTADAWLSNYDANADEIDDILRHVYGRNAELWRRRWRLFFLATSELFGHASGRAWGISQYRLATTETQTCPAQLPNQFMVTRVT